MLFELFDYWEPSSSSETGLPDETPAIPEWAEMESTLVPLSEEQARGWRPALLQHTAALMGVQRWIYQGLRAAEWASGRPWEAMRQKVFLMGSL